MKNKELNANFEKIAQEFLRIETLREQKSDRLDFHEVAVWQLQEALEAAYKLAKDNGAKKA